MGGRTSGKTSLLDSNLAGNFPQLIPHRRNKFASRCEMFMGLTEGECT